MPNPVPANSSYQKLLKDLKAVFIEGLKKIEQEKINAYWKTGELIARDILANKSRADYGKNLLKNLSADLGVSERTLGRAVQLYRAYPIPSALTKLSWLHQLQLISIKNEGKRKAFAQRAIKKDWGYRELEDAIRLERLKVEEPQDKSAPASQGAVVKLSLNRSRLFAYRILEPGYIHSAAGEAEEKVIDLGFSINIQAEIFGLTNLKAGEIIESKKTGNKYSFSRSDAKPKDLYTYVALVERVVDADTLWLNVDCGFKVWTRQKVRLRGIDAPELATPEGKKAKEFVEARLKEIEFVVVKTHSSDKYDRYLADVFYTPVASRSSLVARDSTLVVSEGKFLNQELLDNKFAVLWED